jgi:cytochrome bd-type quinol oxidase subunit 2
MCRLPCQQQGVLVVQVFVVEVVLDVAQVFQLLHHRHHQQLHHPFWWSSLQVVGVVVLDTLSYDHPFIIKYTNTTNTNQPTNERMIRALMGIIIIIIIIVIIINVIIPLLYQL